MGGTVDYREFRVSSPRQLARARRRVANAAASILGADSVDDVSLVVSELVTNALEHGDGDAVVSYGTIVDGDGRRDGFVVATESISSSPPRRCPPPVPPDRVTGRGLNIVHALADDVRVDHSDGIVNVTCSFRRDRHR